MFPISTEPLRCAKMSAVPLVACGIQLQGSKVPKKGVYMVPVLGIVITALGIYSVFGYLEPYGKGTPVSVDFL